MNPVTTIALSLASIVGAAIGYKLGDGYIDRLPNHDGYYQVNVPTEVSEPPQRRPARTVVIVIDGLRQDAAREMKSARRIEAAGLCRPMDVGELTISRPVYAMLSTGLEVDRTGSRNNDETRPILPVSIWQVAKEAGLTVTGNSQLAWWRQLFPDAFSRYTVDEDHATDLFALAELTDVTLIHPTYVDEMGHDHGADSAEYRDAVARADVEIGRLLDRLDLASDAVILTADHGHVDRGGHGDGPDEIAHVLTCMAGVGIGRGGDDVIDARIVAPTLAIVLGVPLPPAMRAGPDGEDNLDQIAVLVDAGDLGESYLAARHRDIDHVRQANANQVKRWLGGDDGRWSKLYERERRAQLWRAAIAMISIIIMFIGSLWLRRLSWQRAAGATVWIVAAFLVPALIYTAWRGGFDFTSINKRSIFVRTGIGSCLAGAAVVLVAHALVFRDPRQMAHDLCTVLIIVVALSLAHRVVYGVPIGFPLPPRIELFFPFFAAAFATAFGVISAVVSVAAFVLSRRRRSR